MLRRCHGEPPVQGWEDQCKVPGFRTAFMALRRPATVVTSSSSVSLITSQPSEPGTLDPKTLSGLQQNSTRCLAMAPGDFPSAGAVASLFCFCSGGEAFSALVPPFGHYCPGQVSPISLHTRFQDIASRNSLVKISAAWAADLQYSMVKWPFFRHA